MPKNEIRNNSSYIEHEATVSKINEEQLFYLMSRGLSEEAATQMIVMAKGIQEKGLWSPLLVRPSGSHYELVLGRKRYYGAKAAHLSEVPCVIAEVSNEETLLMLLADTRDQREGNVVEMALVYQELSDRFSYSQAMPRRRRGIYPSNTARFWRRRGRSRRSPSRAIRASPLRRSILSSPA